MTSEKVVVRLYHWNECEKLVQCGRFFHVWVYEQPSQKNSVRSTHNNVKWSKVEFCSNFNRMGCIYQINFLQLASYFSGWAVSCTFLFRWPPYRRPPPPNKPPKGLPPNSPPNTSPNMSPGKPGTSSHPAVKNLQSTIQNKKQKPTL